MLSLRLFHGRRSLDEVLPGWGLDGPVLGPLRSVSATWGEELRLETIEGNVVELRAVEGFVHYGGVLFGEIDVSESVQPTEQVSELKAVVRSKPSPKSVVVSERFAALVAVFIDAVRESEGDLVARVVSWQIRTVTQEHLGRRRR